MNKIFIKPAIGLAVWLPCRERNVLPEGEFVTQDAYIERRLLDGELVRASTPKTLKKNKPQSEE